MRILIVTIAVFGVIAWLPPITAAQRETSVTYTGTLMTFPSGPRIRTTTSPFTLRITGETSDEEASRLLAMLAEGGQAAVLRHLQKSPDLGSFQVAGRLGPRLRAVRISEVDGKRRIFAVFDRWIQSAELRFGARSLDYPFSVIELFIDPRTGRGEGTFIAAAKVRWTRADGDRGDYQVEIENFGTWPSKLMGVVERGRPRG